MIVTTAFVCFGVGLAVLAVGLIRRSVGTVPHCVGCGYAVEGLEAGRCPECGAELGEAGAVRIGRLARRPRWVMVGVGLIVLSLPITGPAVVSAAGRGNRYAWYPDWLLLREGPGRMRGAPWDFRDEFYARLDGGQFDADERRVFIARAEAALADATTPLGSWFAWAETYGALWRRGDVSDAQMTRVLEQTIKASARLDGRGVSVGLEGPIGALARGSFSRGSIRFVAGELVARTQMPNDVHFSDIGVWIWVPPQIVAHLAEGPISVVVDADHPDVRGGTGKSWSIVIERIESPEGMTLRVRHEIVPTTLLTPPS